MSPRKGSCAQDARRTAERPHRGFRSAFGEAAQLEWKKRKRTDAALEGCAKGLELGELLDVNEKVGPSKNGLPGCAELRRMDAMMCRFLRVLLMEKAYDGTPRKGWRLALMRVENAVRRTAWLQAMPKAPQEHVQVTTAVWSTMLNVSPLDSVGHWRPDAHRYARMFQGGHELFKGFSGTETS